MPVLDEEYEKLLEKAKDPEKSFTINISELLTSYMQKFSAANTSPNFSAAALILQSCGFVYGKKVEYLHNLVTQLAQNMSKFNKNEGSSNKKEVKEREKVTKEKEARINDPFFSTDIKSGKNLSCLKRKRNVANKKQPKKTPNQKQAFVPVDLLPLECEEKGDPFYDVRGKAVGNRGDFNLNKCRMISASGWLLLPTISPDMISESDHASIESADSDSDLENGDFVPATPDDEGYPPSTGSSGAPTASQVPSSQQSDEGIGPSIPCTPEDGNVVTDEEAMDGIECPCPTNTVEGIENIPTDDVNMDLPQRTLRRSTRQALMQCQLQHTDNQLPTEEPDPVEEEVPEEDSELCPVKKAIQKKNTCSLPNKLKSDEAEEDTIFSASQFCARTFFSYGNKQFQKGIRLGVPAFGKNSKFVKRLSEHHEFMKTINKKKRVSSMSGDDDDDDLISLGEEIPLNEDGVPGADEVHLPNLGDNEIVINNDPVLPESQTPEEVGIDRLSEVDAEIAGGFEDETFVAVDHRDSAFRGRLNDDEEISEKVFAWQQKLQPILDSIAQREKFDIYKYGDRIMDYFPESVGKVSRSFKNMCKGKEKWEIHRYFMALLPLVNIGDVSIEKEITNADESGSGKNTEDIFVTLCKRTSHYARLKKFTGHSEGSHS